MSPQKGHLTLYRAIWVLVYCAFVFVPLVLCLVTSDSKYKGLIYEIGKIAALAGFSILVLQVILTSRLKFLDHIFGIDLITRFHKNMALAAGVLLLSHPLLLALGSGDFDIFELNEPWDINLGKLTLAFLILTVSFAMTFSLFSIDYNIWRFLHKTAFFIVILGFIHSISAGSDIDSVTSIICWICLLTLAAAVFIWRNAFVPLWGRDKFEVTEIRPETYNTYTVTLKSPAGKRLPRNPGQFMFLKLKRPGRLSETHPFTISSPPLPDNIVQATIKNSGNFTNTIDQTVAGDIGIIEGPFGRFSFVNYDVKSFLFIAGGVGVTPIMSMLRYLKETGDTRSAVLLYGNRSEKDIIFRTELDNLPSNVKVIHILSNPDDSWHGPRGHISAEIIQQYAADILRQSDIFLCGPPAMMMSINRILKRLDVPVSKIHFELFTI